MPQSAGAELCVVEAALTAGVSESVTKIDRSSKLTRDGDASAFLLHQVPTVEMLARLRPRLAALGAERHRLGRSRYWVLKPDFRPGESIEL